jgi:hypothetical protein
VDALVSVTSPWWVSPPLTRPSNDATGCNTLVATYNKAHDESSAECLYNYEPVPGDKWTQIQYNIDGVLELGGRT